MPLQSPSATPGQSTGRTGLWMMAPRDDTTPRCCPRSGCGPGSCPGSKDSLPPVGPLALYPSLGVLPESAIVSSGPTWISPHPRGFDSREKESDGPGRGGGGLVFPGTHQKLSDSELVFLPSFSNFSMHNPPLNTGQDTACQNVRLDPDVGPPQPSRRRLLGLC